MGHSTSVVCRGMKGALITIYKVIFKIMSSLFSVEKKKKQHSQSQPISVMEISLFASGFSFP